MSEKLDLIYDLIKENRKDLNDFRAEVKEDNTVIQERLVEIEKLDAIQNHQLAEHIRRTELLEELHKENVSRIEKLEEPSKTISTLSKWLIGIGAVAGSVAGILKIIGII